MKKVLLFFITLASLVGIVFVFSDRTSAPSSSTTPSIMTLPTKQNPASRAFNKNRLPTDKSDSLWVIANKRHPLQPTDYVPTDLVFPDVPLRVPGNESMQLGQPAATALKTMFIAAKKDGLELMLSSGYRSYNYQQTLYNGYVNSEGKTIADTQSARPGYSEHQTGLAADIEPASRKCEVEDCFATTPEGQWLKTNAYKYGFLLRYQAVDQEITGYKDESWHYRFIGTDLAGELYKTNTRTLEAFFDVSGGNYL